MNKETIRAIVRPGITFMLVLVCIALVILKALGYTAMDVPDWLIGFTSVAVGWYFSDRTRQHSIEENNKGGNTT